MLFLEQILPQLQTHQPFRTVFETCVSFGCLINVPTVSLFCDLIESGCLPTKSKLDFFFELLPLFDDGTCNA
ncbi:hypothetical protein BpHYR1_025210 [Brachionus plicatilis]|uniref:Uncharacterized protein n=1 Tax=Brachionus plicatilis TaxID=10195 RepID=A0A3M7PYV6_BRAPC|nr:hypothetical protein BpHYR1_025210 [Brachionus plicatilis]